MPESVTHLFVDLGDVLRLSEVNTAPGRWRKDYVTAYSGIRWRVFVASAKERLLAQQNRMELTHTGYCEPDQDVAINDVIRRTFHEDLASSEEYRVLGVEDPSLIQHRKLLLQRILIGEQ